MVKGSLHIFDKQPYPKKSCFFFHPFQKHVSPFCHSMFLSFLGSILMELMRAPATDVGTLLQFTTSEVEAEVRCRFEVLKVLRTCM